MNDMDSMDNMDRACDPGARPLSMREGWFAAGILFLVAVLNTQLIWQPDVMMHVTTGRWMVEHGGLMRHDVFSHTAAGEPWPDFSWGAQLIMSFMVALGGFELLALFRTLVLSSGLMVVWRLARFYGANGWLAAAAMGGAGLCFAQGNEARPYMFTLLLLPLTLYLLLRWIRDDSRGPRLFAWVGIPLLMAAWANLHAAFPAFLLSAAALWVGLAAEAIIRRKKREAVSSPWTFTFLARFAVLIVVCLLATLVNPFGWEVWFLPSRLGMHEIFHRHIAEWSAPTSKYFVPLKLLVVFGVAIGVLNWRQVRLPHAFLVLLWLILAAHARRQISLAATVILPIFALWFQQLWDSRSVAPAPGKHRRWALSALALLVFGLLPAYYYAMTYYAMAFSGFGGKLGVGLATSRRPVSVSEFILRERPVGNMFHEFGFGGDFIYRLYPHYRVALDGRMEVYGPDRFAKYWEIVGAKEGWQQSLREMEVEFIVLSVRGNKWQSLWSRLAASGEWTQVYRDSVAVMFVRNDGPNAGMIARFPQTDLSVPSTL